MSEPDKSALGVWLEEEGRRALLTISLSTLKTAFHTSFNHDENESRKTSLIVSATGSISKRLMDDDIRLDYKDLPLGGLPVSVHITFSDSDQFEALREPFGLMSFSPAINSGDGIVDEPDTIALQMLLPRDNLAPLVSPRVSRDLLVRVDGLTMSQLGPMPGLSRQVWEDCTRKRLRVVACEVQEDIWQSDRDEELDDESEDSSDDKSEAPVLFQDLASKLDQIQAGIHRSAIWTLIGMGVIALLLVT